MKESMGVILFIVGILIAGATVLIILLTRKKKKSNSNSQAYGLHDTNTCSGNGQMVCKCNPGWKGANCSVPETKTTAYFVAKLDCNPSGNNPYSPCKFTPGSIGRQGGPCGPGMPETQCCSSVSGQDIKTCAEVLITDTDNPMCYNGSELSPTCFLDQATAINYAKNLSDKCGNVYPEPVGCW